MNELVILGASLLPAVLLLCYVLNKDTNPEPTRQLLKAMLWGVLIILPVCLVEIEADAMLFGPEGNPTTMLGTVMRAFFTAAIPEESFKLLALWIVLRRNPYYDEHFDGIVYAVCIGLAFAALENIAYVFKAGDMWLPTAISRGLLAVPGHYAFAILMGYYYSVHHFVDRSFKNLVCILLVPVLAHGIYDSIAMAVDLNPYLGGLSTVLIIWFCIKMHKRARKKLLALVERDRFGTFRG